MYQTDAKYAFQVSSFACFQGFEIVKNLDNAKSEKTTRPALLIEAARLPRHTIAHLILAGYVFGQIKREVVKNKREIIQIKWEQIQIKWEQIRPAWGHCTMISAVMWPKTEEKKDKSAF